MEFMPIGTIVRLKGSDQTLMIIGVQNINEKLGYIGVLYPEGYLGKDYMWTFENKDIDHIDYVGYVNSDFQLFHSSVAKAIKDSGDIKEPEVNFDNFDLE